MTGPILTSLILHLRNFQPHQVIILHFTIHQPTIERIRNVHIIDRFNHLVILRSRFRILLRQSIER